VSDFGTNDHGADGRVIIGTPPPQQPRAKAAETSPEPCESCHMPTRPWNLTLLRGERLCPTCLAASKRKSSVLMVGLTALAVVVVVGVGAALAAQANYAASPEPSMALLRMSMLASRTNNLSSKYLNQNTVAQDIEHAMPAQPDLTPTTAISTVGTAIEALVGLKYALQRVRVVSYDKEKGTGVVSGVLVEGPPPKGFALEFEITRWKDSSGEFWQVTHVRNAPQYLAWLAGQRTAPVTPQQ
jgi:hypothetical protein